MKLQSRASTRPHSTLFERVFSPSYPWWSRLLLCAVILALPLLAAFLDGALQDILSDGRLRILMVYPAIVVYIILISPAMWRLGDEVTQNLRSVILLDQEQLDQVINEADRPRQRYEWLAFLVGAALGWFTLSGQLAGQPLGWLLVEWYLSCMLMYALLAWTIFISIVSTRITSALHNQPMRIDILNPLGFQAVGRQSLLLALVFIGGMSISLMLTFNMDNLSAPAFWIFNLGMAAIVVLIFFLNMHPTHKVLAAAKKAELEPLAASLNQTGRALAHRRVTGGDASGLAAEYLALSSFEQRLREARTWPYNTNTLRTLFFSVLIPLGSVMLRLLVELIVP